jgi:hypothetical protein
MVPGEHRKVGARQPPVGDGAAGLKQKDRDGAGLKWEVRGQ